MRCKLAVRLAVWTMGTFLFSIRYGAHLLMICTHTGGVELVELLIEFCDPISSTASISRRERFPPSIKVSLVFGTLDKRSSIEITMVEGVAIVRERGIRWSGLVERSIRATQWDTEKKHLFKQRLSRPSQQRHTKTVNQIEKGNFLRQWPAALSRLI